jgi:hypothetical protein
MRSLSGWFVLAGIGLLAPAATAAERNDGVYGRLDGDLAVALEAGVLKAFPGEAVTLRPSVLYLQTVGLWGHYQDSFEVGGQPIARAFAFGVELRPLFLPRFTADLEQGPATLDLFLDSLSLGIGAFGAAVAPARCADPEVRCWLWGIELEAGLELPLLGQADGPFIGLRGALRLPEPDTAARRAEDETVTGQVGLSLGYRLVFTGHLVDAGEVE